MKVHETKTMTIRGKKDKVFREATAIMEKAYPRINEFSEHSFWVLKRGKNWGRDITLSFTAGTMTKL